MPTKLSLVQNEDFDDYYFHDGGDEKDEMADKYAEDINNFQSGLTGMNRENRGCTNVFCLLIYFATLIGMVVLAVYGIKNGQVNKMIAPIDTDDHFCGTTTGYEDYPKMYFTKLDTPSINIWGIFDSGVCVKECPDGTKNKALVNGQNCKDNSKTKCQPQTNTYSTYAIGGYCIPTEVTDAQKAAVELLKNSFVESAAGEYIVDIYDVRQSIFISIAMAFVYSLIFIKLMSLFAETLAKISLVCIQLGFVALTALFFYEWYVIKKGEAKLTTEADKTAYWEKQGWKPFLLMTGFVIFLIITMIAFCMICCYWESLNQAIDVIDASADFVNGNYMVWVIPNIHLIIQVLFFIFWVIGMTCVASLNEISPDALIPQSRKLTWTRKTQFMGLFMFFGLLWVNNVIEYCSRFVVITSACTYYFNSKKGEVEEGDVEIGYGFKIAYINHIGSIAFAACIISIIQFIKYTFYSLCKRIEKIGGDNCAVKCLISCATCCLNCIERICDYLNESAFCYMAVSGEPFLASAWAGFLMNLKHGAKFLFANSIAKVFIFLGKLAITLTNCFSLMMIINYITKTRGQISSPIGPVVVVGLISWVTAGLFLSMFDETVMALLTCVSFDLDMNNGDLQYGPQTFHDKFYDKKENDEEKE